MHSLSELRWGLIRKVRSASAFVLVASLLVIGCDSEPVKTDKSSSTAPPEQITKSTKKIQPKPQSKAIRLPE